MLETGVLPIFDAGINDLATLLDNLDLQATPSTPDMMPLCPSASMSGRVGGLDWEREDWILAIIAASFVSAEQGHRLLAPATQYTTPAQETRNSSSTISPSAEMCCMLSFLPARTATSLPPAKLAQRSFTPIAMNMSSWAVVDPLKFCISIPFKS
ncbi:hypothetical protein CVT25_012152 [Psilocybe cyanescens]|uniref:Uncharacterized protein n=1 Tax=Psilocybe cyanescens TaxID=93625 RepID=A0A409XH49_PSICY|nr:hypothetical protein CVT25_012152 [Psilocybe cyanescens]